MIINIRREFPDDFITREAGEKLRMMILKGTKETIQIDFDGLQIASTSFFDEAFGKLADEGWKRKDFDSRIQLKNLNQFDSEVLEKVLRYRGLKK